METLTIWTELQPIRIEGSVQETPGRITTGISGRGGTDSRPTLRRRSTWWSGRHRSSVDHCQRSYGYVRANKNETAQMVVQLSRCSQMLPGPSARTGNKHPKTSGLN